jgi:membrane protein DedA with SNARE-associated domain
MLGAARVTQPDLPGIFGAVEPILASYGYLAVAAFVLLEDFGVPLPGETILIAGAVYAGAGKLDVVVLSVIAVLAAVVGDNIGYLIGRLGGRRLVLRWGRYVFLTERRVNKAEQFFDRHGGKVVTVARFIEGLRQANGIIAGISEMHWLRFVAFNALGAALWVALWVSVGYVAGQHINALYHQLHEYEIYVAVGVGALILTFIAYRIVKHLRERRA